MAIWYGGLVVDALLQKIRGECIMDVFTSITGPEAHNLCRTVILDEIHEVFKGFGRVRFLADKIYSGVACKVLNTNNII